MDYVGLADRARSALITAAMRRTLLTYKELGQAIGLAGDLPLPHHINRVLDAVSKRCIDHDEPSLADLVVSKDMGEPGSGFTKGALEWHTEAQRCFRFW